MFADVARIFVKSGKGGNGHVSFRRELYVPAGGPDGGDGGKGGDVIFEVDTGLNTLEDFRNQVKYIATPGEEGGGKRMHGKNGKDMIIRVPEGTIIKDDESGKIIADMSGSNNRLVLLKGGRGGLGFSLPPTAPPDERHGARHSQHDRSESDRTRRQDQRADPRLHGDGRDGYVRAPSSFSTHGATGEHRADDGWRGTLWPHRDGRDVHRVESSRSPHELHGPGSGMV